MKKIGILGGMGPYSTNLFYQEILNYCKKKNLEFPPMIINSVDFQYFFNNFKNKKKLKDFLVKEIKKVENYSDFTVIPCNTAHSVAKEIEKNSKNDLITIHSPVIKKILREDIKSIYILGTSVTIKSSFYQKNLKKEGIQSIIPNNKLQNEIDKIIYTVVFGKNWKENKTKLDKIIKEILKKEKNILLACTELPLVVKKENYSHGNILSSTKILAEETVKKANNNE